MGRFSRRQIAQFALLAVLLIDALLFGLAQVDRVMLGEQQDLLAALERQLRAPRGGVDPAALTRELGELQERARATSIDFPDAVDLIALQDHVVQVARNNRIQLSRLALQAPTTRDLAAGRYPLTVISVEGQGELSHLARFLDQASLGLYRTSGIEKISVSQGVDAWALKFDMVIYGKPA